MPELPEAEAITRTVRPLVEHRRIRCVHVHPIATKSQTPDHVTRLSQDRRIQSVTRLGKYLLLSLDRGILTSTSAWTASFSGFPARNIS